MKMTMTEKFKILGKYIKDMSSETPDVETYIFVKDRINKYQLGIDINSFPLKNNMAEVNIKLTFDNKSDEDKKANFEMTHTTVVKVEESAVNKDELKKIFLSDVPTEIYPEIEKRFFEIVKSIGYPEIKLEKKINEIVDCSIISIHKFGIFVSIDRGIADALLPIRALPNDWYDFDQIKQTLIGERTGNKFNVGMQLKVKIVEVIPLTGSITVKWISNKMGNQK